MTGDAGGGFFEIVIDAAELTEAGFEGRDEIEDQLEFLEDRDLGEVSGGGAGSGVVIIEVDVYQARKTEKVIALVISKLRSLGVPKGTLIECRQPIERTVKVWE